MAKRNGFNAAVDVASLISFIPLVISGLVLFFIISPRLHLGGGVNPLFSSEFLALGRPGWLWIHDISGFLFVGLMVIHLGLHASYFRGLKK